MKTIDYTNQEFSLLGNRIKTTVYYTDGTTRVVLPNDKRTKEQTREWMFYTIKRFQERHEKTTKEQKDIK